MVKKDKNQRNTDRNKAAAPEKDSKKNTLSGVFLDKLKDAFTDFDKLSELERVERYGKKEYLEQFWEYFKREHENLLDKVDKKDLPIYMQALQNLGFSVGAIKTDAGKLHHEFASEDTEEHIIEQSLSKLKNFCADDHHALPKNAFDEFARFAGFNPTTFKISDTGNIKTIHNLPELWQKFVRKESIKIKESSSKTLESILRPEYNPTERIMVTVAITKMKKELKGSLKDAFDAQFSLPIDIFTSYQDLLSFKTELSDFLITHADEIDESLAKKLDSIIVTNGDIQKELLKTGKSLDTTKGFSEREQYFRRIFNKLVTRQLFDEIKKTQDTIDHYLGNIGDTFKEFPPYVNEILKIYPFNDKIIVAIDSSFHSDLDRIDGQILAVQEKFATADDKERQALKKQIVALKQERELRRWKAYIAFLETKAPSLAAIFTQLVDHAFDFSVLSLDQQQLLVDTLIRHKLEDTIVNKVPELLSVSEESITQFVHDLFDLKKMDISLHTKYGPIPLTFLKKEFLSSSRTQLPGIADLENIKNLPLNFVTQLTASNAALFEDSHIFNALYTDFAAKNGQFRLNDAYKVKIKKDGNTVEGYLSAYCPLDEYNTESYDGKQLYLYSEPITSPNQERKLVTREGTDDGNPVIIKNEEQASCDMEVIDKKINLNGEALGALLFSYVLGQESMAQKISPQQEEALSKKFDKIAVYKEKEEGDEEAAPPVQSLPESVEKSEKEKFFDDRKQLKGYGFPDPQSKHFVKGTRLLIPFADSEVPPLQSGGRSWMQIEITDVNNKKGTFTTKISGGELRLGKYEGIQKEMAMNSQTIGNIKSIFGDEIYKFPPHTGYGFEEQMDMLNGPVSKELEKHFGSLTWQGDGFIFNLGDAKGEKVTHFGRYEENIGEKYDEESGNCVLYSVKHNANNTFTVTGEVNTKDTKTIYPPRDMDYAMFMIFVKEKGLQPKSKKQAETMKKTIAGISQETPTMKRGFSINSVLGFFKNTSNKIKDAIKKYDDELTEDLTDFLTKDGQLYSRIGGFLPFARVASSFEMMGAEYFLERDNRIRKKVEKRKKFYEDADFSLIYVKYIQPMLKGEIVIKPHYKAAAMLLAMIAKGKGPYNRNPQFAGKGMRINILMGPEHQARYLDMKQKKIRELEQGASTFGSIWAANKKNEIVELEMRYIVHTMDARQLGVQDGDKTKYYFYGKYSKMFIDELDKGYNAFFSQNSVDEGYGKNKDAPFEFARGEFFRMIGDRPQQALPFLKVMATKAMTEGQWKVFETAVMAGMLSGVFLTMTYSSTQSFIQKICRTRGFIPGIWVTDIHQQTKLQRILDIFSKGSDKNFTASTGYKSTDFSFDTFNDPRGFLKWNPDSPGTLQKWLNTSGNLNKLSNFLKLTGKDAANKKTLLDIYADPKTSHSDKLLLSEFLHNGNEKDESLDSDVRNNPAALTGSILTKSQSAVHQLLRVDQSGFAGKDGDEIQTMKGFFTDMSKAIPRHSIDSKEQVKFFLDKFFNRFDEKGFSGNNVTTFINRLKRCKQHQGKKEIDDILYYSIVGQIVESLGRGTIPVELEQALISWKEFFKHNLDTILTPDILISSFGGPSYEQDYQRAQPKFEPRESCINLLDRDMKQTLFYDLTSEQRKQMNIKLQHIKSKEYLNGALYDLAEKMERNFSIQNRFKSGISDDHLDSMKRTAAMNAPKITGAKIKNSEIAEKIKRNLEGKPPMDVGDNQYYGPNGYFLDDDDWYNNGL